MGCTCDPERIRNMEVSLQDVSAKFGCENKRNVWSPDEENINAFNEFYSEKFRSEQRDKDLGIRLVYDPDTSGDDTDTAEKIVTFRTLQD